MATIYLYSEHKEKEAIKWFEQSESYNTLGIIFKYGENIKQDYSEALKFLNLAAEAGDEVAMYELADLYYKGLGVPKEFELSAKWYKYATESNYKSFILEIP